MRETTGGRPQKRPGILDELLPDGSMVLYRADRREVITLNPLAAYVWECCDGAQDTAAIIAAVREIFPDVPNVVRDVTDLLADLRARDLLVPVLA